MSDTARAPLAPHDEAAIVGATYQEAQYPTNPKSQKQRWTIKDAPEHIGDCWRTAIAILLGLDRDEVPHFIAGEGPGEGDWYDKTVAWLKERGWKMRSPSIHMVMRGKGSMPDHGYLIASGITDRSASHLTSDEPWAEHYRHLREHLIHHATVVSHDFQEMIDPHPEGGGIVAFTDFTILERINPSS